MNGTRGGKLPLNRASDLLQACLAQFQELTMKLSQPVSVDLPPLQVIFKDVTGWIG